MDVKKYLPFFLLLVACSQTTKNSPENLTSTLNPVEASRFTAKSVGKDIILTIDKPWQGHDQSLKYYLYQDSVVNKAEYDDHVFVKVPVRSIASNSTTHLGLLEVLGVEDRLVGFAQSKYIYSTKIREQVARGRVTEIGLDRGLNVETVLDLNPDMVMAFSSGAENSQLSQLQSLGVPVVMNADYMETSVLGRAEWLKFLAFFVDKTDEANQYFDQLVVSYDSLKALVVNQQRPTVMSGTIYSSAWYMPGGQNYNAKIIKDAGGAYMWGDNNSSGWHSLDFEAVYAHASEADFWIGVGNFNSLEEMTEVDPRYAEFKAYKQGNVYTYNNLVNEYGGSDYFESGNVYPDRLLADHIKILHPELLPDYELYYYRRLD